MYVSPILSRSRKQGIKWEAGVKGPPRQMFRREHESTDMDWTDRLSRPRVGATHMEERGLHPEDERSP